MEAEFGIKWMGKLISDTDDMVNEALGQPRDVQAALLLGARHGWPLDEVGWRVAASEQTDGTYGGVYSGGYSGPMLTLESICARPPPDVVRLYRELSEILRDEEVGEAVAKQAENSRSDADRPANFFQAPPRPTATAPPPVPPPLRPTATAPPPVPPPLRPL